MKRLVILLALAALSSAGTAVAASPYFLDRAGTLWHGYAETGRLVLTGERDGVQVVRSVVPFQLGMSEVSDTEIQVAADELSGKVVVVWQRNWSESASEIMLAVWSRGSWELIESLTPALEARPRFPLIKLTDVSSRYTTPAATEDEADTVVEVRESFVHVLWWQGVPDAQQAWYGLIRLGDAEAAVELASILDLDSLVGLGMSCDVRPNSAVLEHPLFAHQNAHDRAMLFFGSDRICLFHLVEVGFELEPEPDPDEEDGLVVTAQRRRHAPIFGVKGSYQVPAEVGLDGARIVLGANLSPVAYRVDGDEVEYSIVSEDGWSPRRTLAINPSLTLDQVIPLIENLAR